MLCESEQRSCGEGTNIWWRANKELVDNEYRTGGQWKDFDEIRRNKALDMRWHRAPIETMIVRDGCGIMLAYGKKISNVMHMLPLKEEDMQFERNVILKEENYQFGMIVFHVGIRLAILCRCHACRNTRSNLIEISSF